MAKIGVYILTNKVNGAIYIGSTIDLDRRLMQHRSLLCNRTHHTKLLQESFEVSDVFQLNFIPCNDKASANALEIRLLGLVKNHPLLTNVLSCGKPQPDEVRSKISTNVSKSSKGHKKPESMKVALAAYRTGRKHTQETKDKVSKANTGRKHIRSPEYCEAVRKRLLKRVSIEGVVYESMSEVAQVFGLSPSSVTNRVKSTDPRYTNWVYI